MHAARGVGPCPVWRHDREVEAATVGGHRPALTLAVMAMVLTVPSGASVATHAGRRRRLPAVAPGQRWPAPARALHTSGMQSTSVPDSPRRGQAVRNRFRVEQGYGDAVPNVTVEPRKNECSTCRTVQLTWVTVVATVADVTVSVTSPLPF